MSEIIYRMYSQHGGHFLELPKCTLKTAREIANAAAELGHVAFYRLFEEDAFGKTRFKTAFSVYGGVREHTDVTFPHVHA